MELTYNETVDIFDVKYIAGSTKGYTLPSIINETIDINLMLKSSIPNEVKVDITIDDNRIKSNLITSKTIRFIKKSFFSTILGFTQSHSGVSGDIIGFIQLIP